MDLTQNIHWIHSFSCFFGFKWQPRKAICIAVHFSVQFSVLYTLVFLYPIGWS